MSELLVKETTCEYRTNPLGLGTRLPRFSWVLEKDRRGTMQRAYQLQVSLQEAQFNLLLWDSGVVESEQSVLVAYEGPALQSRTRYYYRVRVWDSFGNVSPWSQTAWWETGILDAAEWKAQWITPAPDKIAPDAEPAFLLRNQFEVKKAVLSARAYATAEGVYELYMNGTKIGDELLAPGWTSYTSRLQVQAYDVTGALRDGTNGIGIMLGDGWFKGELGFDGKRAHYGDHRAAFVQLHIRYEDGTEDVLVTDETWKASLGPIQFADLYHGEVYDAQLEDPFWCTGNSLGEQWSNVSVLQDKSLGNLIMQENVPTRVTEVIKPVSYLVTPKGEHVLDFGQNMVGRVRMKVEAPAGTTITIRHAEVLDPEGNFFTENLRTARQTITYTAKGEGLESYAPHFTFMGFRYIQVEGYPDVQQGLPLDSFMGEVIHSDMQKGGAFECSDELINRLQQNIVWGQRGNFLDVPTDCPQRNERLGWTGDAQVFIRTALYNYHGGAFFTKWLRDLREEQLPNGGVPVVIPSIVKLHSSSAWGDAATIIPWAVYRQYGDVRLLEEQYSSMTAWVEYIRAQGSNEFLWNTGFHFGDWLALDARANSFSGATPRDLIATAYYAHSTRIVRDAAVALGKTEDAAKYTALWEGIVQAFRKEFITETGRVVAPTQTAHVLALFFDLVEGEHRKRVAHDLNELIIGEKYHLSTGFVGTPYLCFVLTQNGYHDTATKLLLQKSYPSWLYPVTMGATTIWEQWDTIKPDGSIRNDGMNSFNHYAYGAIGDWMYRRIAGLDMQDSGVGYKRISIHPHIGRGELSHAKAVYPSSYGEIVSGWRLEGEWVQLEVKIPANTTAIIQLDQADRNSIKENQAAVGETEGVQVVAVTEQGVTLSVGSGSYSFVYRYEGSKIVYSDQSRVIDLMERPETAAILLRYVPGVNKPPFSFASMSRTLQELSELEEANLSREQLNELLGELSQL
jgi:alpha-L-rhamnosidase